jgi:hypothetical protein
MLSRETDESLEDYAKRIGEKLKLHEAARRDAEPRYDVERHVVELLEAQGLPVCDTAYALNPDVTPNHLVMVLELHHRFGMEVRVIAERTSLGEVTYRDVQRMRDGDATWVDGVTKAVVRQLMVAQRAEAQAWLDANPEDTTRGGFEHI